VLAKSRFKDAEFVEVNHASKSGPLKEVFSELVGICGGDEIIGRDERNLRPIVPQIQSAVDEEIEQIHSPLMESFSEFCPRDFLKDFFVAFLPNVGRVCQQNIESVLGVEHLGKIDLEIKILLSVREFVNQFADFLLQFLLLRVVGLVEKEWLQLFQPTESLLVELCFLHPQQ